MRSSRYAERGYLRPTFDDYVEALNAKRRNLSEARWARVPAPESRSPVSRTPRASGGSTTHGCTGCTSPCWNGRSTSSKRYRSEFFNELSKQFPDQLVLTTVTIDQRVVAFSFSLATAAGYYILFCGVDYDLNRIADLYFNVMYAELGQALSVRTDTIQVGQTADEFKTHLGCTASPRSICVRGVVRWLTRLLAPLSEIAAAALSRRNRAPRLFATGE